MVNYMVQQDTEWVDSDGVLFSFDTTTNIYTKLYDFKDSTGVQPNGNLIQLSNGKLYGTCYRGGKFLEGVIFSYDPSNNKFTKLWDFNSLETGENPFGTLLLASDGNIYGTTENGGLSREGNIFRFNPDKVILIKIYLILI